MAFGANTIWDVRTGGSDTNGGGFDPGATLSITNLTTDTNTGNTASPVVSSASYNFVAGDVGAWLFIKSGTNWIPGWYQIASVSGGKATLSAAIGSAYLMASNMPVALNDTAGFTLLNLNSGTAVDGCATVGTPTSGTATIDYSQQNTAAATGTASSSTTTVTATTSIFHPGMVGNYITDGTTWREITGYTSATVVTVDAAPSWTSASVTVGGALASPGKAGGLKVAGNDVFMASGTYSLTTTSANVAAGRVNDTTGGVDQTNPTWWVGYNSLRHINSTDTTWPTINANANSSITLFTVAASYMRVRNLCVDGDKNNTTSVTGFSCTSQNYCRIDYVKAQNCEVNGINVGGGNCSYYRYLSATGCSGTAGINASASCTLDSCEAYANSTSGIVCSANSISFINCISSGNTGKGFDDTSVGGSYQNCTAYGNTSNGFNTGTSIGAILYRNCIAEANGAAGWGSSAVRGLVTLINCAGYNNTGGHYSNSNITDVRGFINNTTGSFFTNAASGDFSLNSTAGQGTLARAAGFPGLMPRGTTTGYLDIGAVQHQDSGGGGGLVNPIISASGGLIMRGLP